MLSLDSLEMALDVLIFHVTSVVGDLLCVLHGLLEPFGIGAFGQCEGGLTQTEVRLGVVGIDLKNTLALINGLLILLRENLTLSQVVTTGYLKVFTFARLGRLLILLELVYGGEVFGRCIRVVLVSEESVGFRLNLLGFLQSFLDSRIVLGLHFRLCCFLFHHQMTLKSNLYLA